MTAINIFDMARWKPITHERFVSEMGNIALTHNEPNQIDTNVAQLPDTRIRMTVMAALRVSDGQHTKEEVGPWLISLFDPQGGKTFCFIRSDGSELHFA